MEHFFNKRNNCCINYSDNCCNDGYDGSKCKGESRYCNRNNCYNGLNSRTRCSRIGKQGSTGPTGNTGEVGPIGQLVNVV